jgi:WNK lysine deficient protein kinase
MKGVKPENYFRVDSDDLRELIDLCIRSKRAQRPSVRELLNHSWFMENNGLKIDVLRDKTTNQAIYKNETQVKFRLKLIDKSKRKANWPVWMDNEEIEIIFDIPTDDPEQIVKELKEKTNKISDEDIRYLTQAIRDKCLVLKLEREDKLEEENQSFKLIK